MICVLRKKVAVATRRGRRTARSLPNVDALDAAPGVMKQQREIKNERIVQLLENLRYGTQL